MEKEIILSNFDKNIIYNDLDHLSGTWSDEEFINFTANTAGFNRIDEEEYYYH